MPHSLRAKLSGLRYKGILEDKDYKRLCKALDNEDVLEKIKAEIEACREDEEPHLCDHRHYRNEGIDKALEIIDRQIGDKE
jgi:hypothetical protein